MGGLNPGGRLALEKPLLRGAGTGWTVTVAPTTGRLSPVAKAMHSWQLLQPGQSGLSGFRLGSCVALAPCCAAIGQSHGMLDADFASKYPSKVAVALVHSA